MTIRRDENGRHIPKPKPLWRRARRTPDETPTENETARSVPPDDASEVEKRAGGRRRVRSEDAPPRSTGVHDERGELEPWMCGAWLRGHVGELRCRRPRLVGARRCSLHGSKTQRSIIAAERNILLAADPASAKLRAIIDDPHAPYNAIIAAAKDVLDRADISGRTKVEHSTGDSPFEIAVGLVKLTRGPRPGAAEETLNAEIEGPTVQPAISGEVVDAEIVEDPPPTADNVVPLSRARRQTASAMVSQTDLEDGLHDGRKQPRGERNTPSEFSP